VIATQILSLDRIVQPQEIQERMRGITMEDLRAVAETYLFNADFSISALLEDASSFPSYDQIRLKLCSPL
jgi:predicted Zn-dependent peptidase